MLRDTLCQRGKVSYVRTRGANNTTLHKRFPGGHITIADANCAAGLAVRPHPASPASMRWTVTWRAPARKAARCR